jgi:hypothetical protein
MTNAEIVADFIKHRGDGPASAAAARVALAQLEADAQALADVRTLDDWAADRDRDEGPMSASHSTRRPENNNRGDWVAHLFSGYEGDEDSHDFQGATPEAARAKAAAWVREQSNRASADLAASEGAPTCEHKTIVGGNDCRWCADCGADFEPHVEGLVLIAPSTTEGHK